MKKKVIKITESDLERVVKRIIDEGSHEPMFNEYGEDELGGSIGEESEWISKAIKSVGSLKRSMGKDDDEEISSSELDSELAKLRAKDKDPREKGVQGLGKKDLTKYRRLNLAKTLRKLKK